MSAPVEFKPVGRSVASGLKDLTFSRRMQMLCFMFQHHFEMVCVGVGVACMGNQLVGVDSLHG